MVPVPYLTIPVLGFLLCHVIYMNSCGTNGGNVQISSHHGFPWYHTKAATVVLVKSEMGIISFKPFVPLN
jgi:hypothetical protein